MSELNHSFEEVKFHHIVIEGTDYEMGQQLASHIKQDDDRVKKYTSEKLDPKKYGFETIEEMRIYYEKACPGITEELRGVADSLNLSIDMMSYWETSLCSPSMNTCSQFAVLPSVTEDGHAYFGRNYDYDTTRDDRVLCTTRAKGKASHIGFTAFLHGRHDGMNEHGLTASLSGGGVFNVPLKQRGFVIWVAIRSILESCRSVKEALKLLKKIPVGEFDNLVLIDRNNNAALVEYADGIFDVKQISDKDPDGFLFSVNHFSLPKTKQFNQLNKFLLTHSTQRSRVIKSTLESKGPHINKHDIQRLLSTHHPDGLCNHYYNDGFGTLWSVIFDATDREVDVCFGAPSHNDYRTFGFHDPLGVQEYTGIAPVSNEKLPI
ncbi:MAG: C45 family autoproteolytic acyltransferase/hydrolase [Candidatus Thorarchaeota archaeon]|jgi:predicted choloylglycine hydrolase